jgi:hypothetical protein
VRRLVLRLIVFNILALLAVPAAAAAKAGEAVKVCGASACMRTDDPGIVGPLRSTFAPVPAPAPAPFFVVSFEDGKREVWSYIYVPSVRAMRSDAFGRGPARWQDASLIRASLPDLTRLEPYSASKTWRPPAGSQPEVPWVPFPTAAANADVVRVCGASACVDTNAPQQLGPLSSNIGAPAATPAAAPFYVVRFEDQQREVWSYIYVPSVRAMRSDEFGHGRARWRDAPPEIVSALPDLTGLEPYRDSSAWSTGTGGQSSPWPGPLLTVVAAVLLAAGVAFRRGRTASRRRDPVPATPPVTAVAPLPPASRSSVERFPRSRSPASSPRWRR